MPASDALIVAATDQYRAYMLDLTGRVGEHIATCPNGGWDCPGSQVSYELNLLSRAELRIWWSARWWPWPGRRRGDSRA